MNGRRTAELVAAAVVAVVLGIGAGRAHAQGDGEFLGEWLWEVTTDDGDALVEPGETAAVTLSMDLDPSVGEPGPTPGFVIQAFAAGIFDVLGGRNADTGQVAGWEIPQELLMITGDLTTTNGVSLFNVNVGQILEIPPDTSDPLDVITFFWETKDFSERTVEYATQTEALAGFEWDGTHFSSVQDFFLTPVEASISFDVIPAPGTGAVTVLFSSLLVRRRRVAITGVVCAAGVGVCMAQQQEPAGEVRLVTPTLLFDGPNLADSTDSPPDPVIAASSTHVAIMVNRMIATYKRSDLPNPSINPIECMTFAEFFKLDGVPDDNGDSFDPRIVFDHNSGRFVASSLKGVLGELAELRIAHSDTGNLDADVQSLSEWTSHPLVQGFTDIVCDDGTGENMALDQPGLGYDNSAWYVAAPLAEPPTDVHGMPIAFDSAIWVVPKPGSAGGPEAAYPVRGRDFVDGAGQPLGCLDVDLHDHGVHAPRPAEAIGRGPDAAPAGYLVGFSRVLG